LARRRIIRERNETFLELEATSFVTRDRREQAELFTAVSQGSLEGALRHTFGLSDKTSGAIKTVTQLSEQDAGLKLKALRSTGSLASQSKPVTPFHLDRVTLFTRILDYEMVVDTSDVYNPLWSTSFEFLTRE
jgi:hypothetical protein